MELHLVLLAARTTRGRPLGAIHEPGEGRVRLMAVPSQLAVGHRKRLSAIHTVIVDTRSGCAGVVRVRAAPKSRFSALAPVRYFQRGVPPMPTGPRREESSPMAGRGTGSLCIRRGWRFGLGLGTGRADAD